MHIEQHSSSVSVFVVNFKSPELLEVSYITSPHSAGAGGAGDGVGEGTGEGVGEGTGDGAGGDGLG